MRILRLAVPPDDKDFDSLQVKAGGAKDGLAEGWSDATARATSNVLSSRFARNPLARRLSQLGEDKFSRGMAKVGKVVSTAGGDIPVEISAKDIKAVSDGMEEVRRSSEQRF